MNKTANLSVQQKTVLLTSISAAMTRQYQHRYVKFFAEHVESSIMR